jgi:hypothetical protein
MRLAVPFAIFLLAAPVLVADEHHVVSDEKTDFSTFKTFTIHEGKTASRKPEINNKLTLKSVEDAIRSGLLSKGLKESQDRPDLVVTFSLDEQGQRGVIGRGLRNTRVIRTSEGTLVLLITHRATNNLVWQGVYLDDEGTAAKLAKKLPNDARKLLKEYPPKKK